MVPLVALRRGSQSTAEETPVPRATWQWSLSRLERGDQGLPSRVDGQWYLFFFFIFNFVAWIKISIINRVELFLFSEITNALPRSVQVAGASFGTVVGSCLAGFLIGLGITVTLCFLYMKRQKPRIPGSPHYISKQNPYVTVPLKEVRSLTLSYNSLL